MQTRNNGVVLAWNSSKNNQYLIDAIMISYRRNSTVDNTGRNLMLSHVHTKNTNDREFRDNKRGWSDIFTCGKLTVLGDIIELPMSSRISCDFIYDLIEKDVIRSNRSDSIYESVYTKTDIDSIIEDGVDILFGMY